MGGDPGVVANTRRHSWEGQLSTLLYCRPSDPASLFHLLSDTSMLRQRIVISRVIHSICSATPDVTVQCFGVIDFALSGMFARSPDQRETIIVNMGPL